MTNETLLECPCCKLRTLPERGHYEICSICNWEDDPLQEERPDYEGGANPMSLNEARTIFMKRTVTIDINKTLQVAISSEPSPPKALAVLSWIRTALHGAIEDWDEGAGENWARVLVDQRVVAFVHMHKLLVIVAADARAVLPGLHIKGVQTIMVPDMDAAILRANRDLIAKLADRQISEMLDEAQFSAEDLVWATV